MTVSPVLFDVSADPGISVTRVIEIKNDTNAEQKYTLSSENFVPQGEDGGQSYLSDTSIGLASWMNWDHQPVYARADGITRIPVTIRVPNDAIGGGYYATVFVSPSRAEDATTTVGISEQIGVLFLVRVSGQVTERATVNTFRVRSSDEILHRLPVEFEVRIKNEGSVHIRPQGSIVVRNAIGKTVSVLPLNSNHGAILPGGTRRYRIIWGSAIDPLEDGRETFIHEVKEEFVHFAFGRYTAEIRGVYGDQSQALARVTVSFWIIPWHLCIAVAMLIIGLCLVFRAYHCYSIRCMVARSDALRKTKRKSSSS